MKRKTYLPTKLDERVIWLNNFASKIGGYATTFNITVGEVSAIAAMALIYSYVINLIDASKTFTKALTSFKNTLSIAPSGTTLGLLPKLTPAAAPPLSQAGIFTFISGIVQRIKATDPGYTETIGNDLGIIGEETVFVPDDYKANGKATSMTGFVKIEFDKLHIEAMDIYSNPVGGTDPTVFEKTGTANHSPFHDTRPLAAAGKPENRNYQTRGVIHDTEIGHPSDTFSVTFAG